ncbi:MAG: aldose epimerase family protein [Novosphingobium sp.]
MAIVPSATVRPFGTTEEGEHVYAIKLVGAGGAQVTLLTLGATIQSIMVADREGQLADVVLGHATPAEYCASPHYFGATVGRVANRLSGGRCPVAGNEYRIDRNDGRNALHGGVNGFDKRIWTISSLQQGESPGVNMQLQSPDGDQGFPGNLAVNASFRLDPEDRLHVEYRASTDRATAVNLTNHAYWNLGGEGSRHDALDHVLMIPAATILEIDRETLPTGNFIPVGGTPFDFRVSRTIAAGFGDWTDPQLVIARGYDHNWVLSSAEGLRLAATLADPRSGRALEVWTDKPGVQFYSGNFLDGTRMGKSGKYYRKGDGIALEPQNFPDTPNRPEFGSIEIVPGGIYRHRIVFSFSQF